MAINLNDLLGSGYSNVSDPRRRTAQTFNQGNLWIDQEGGYSRDADGQRYWDPDGTAIQNSYYMGGAPGAGTKLMRLDEIEKQVPGSTEAYRRIAGDKILNLNGMEFLTEQDAAPILQAMKGASTFGTLVGDNLYKVLMAAVGGMGAGGVGSTGEFAGMGTFGGSALANGGSLLSTLSGGAGATGAGGSMAAADAAGLAQMAADAGLTGAAADAFVASGGTLGSAAAGGGGLDILQWAQQYPGAVDPTSGALNWDAITKGMSNLQGVTAGTGADVPGFWENLLNGVTPSPGNVANGIKSLLPGSGNGSGETFGISNEILKGILGAGIGAYGSDKMADAISGVGNQQNALAQQYLDMGAPWRKLALDTTKPGYSLENEPGLRGVLDQAQDVFMRAASAGNVSGVSGGNPWSNPGTMAEGMKYVTNSVSLPYLQNLRGWYGQMGGQGLNTSASMFGNAANAGMNAANADMGGIRALGYGLSSLFPTSSPYDDYMKQLSERTRQQNEQYRMTIGGVTQR